MTHDYPSRRPSEVLAEKLGLPPLAPWTEDDEARFNEKMERADRELAALIARRNAEAA
ncbi:hypothetical protein [Actinoplanes sp. L3-i22]|uniref:hypothetical protein n=1 Tax=Actinoplanes sp. L3-i22 TaxID=2836373 RepID=UPI001C77A2E0|nr:hypothetical protein [Actinoplanes sp. L3-i22]BCY10119.1 hypothetical protein L3i22_052070 [Actinoplanes sp. L3-i22]